MSEPLCSLICCVCVVRFGRSWCFVNANQFTEFYEHFIENLSEKEKPVFAIHIQILSDNDEACCVPPALLRDSHISVRPYVT